MATSDVGKGRMVSMITDDDTETTVSEFQIAEENDLPVIQLFSLVEELRYGARWLPGRPFLTVWPWTSETVKTALNTEKLRPPQSRGNSRLCLLPLRVPRH